MIITQVNAQVKILTRPQDNNNGTRPSHLIMGELSFEVAHFKCTPGRLFISKLVFAQVQLTPHSSIHTDTSGG